MVTLGWPWPILQQGQIWPLRLLYWKRAKLSIYVKHLQPMTFSLWHHLLYVPKVRVIYWLYTGCLRFSIFIFSKTAAAGLIESKLHVEPLWDDRRKVCSWGFGQMIKIFAMPIYGKNSLKILLRTWKGRRSWNLVCSIGDSGPTRFILMVTIDWLWPILNMKSKQLISKVKYWKTELWKYKVQGLSAKELKLQKQTCSPTWALVSVMANGPLVVAKELKLQKQTCSPTWALVSVMANGPLVVVCVNWNL